MSTPEPAPAANPGPAITPLLDLQADGTGAYIAHCHLPNLSGRAYGGQVLGQAMRAACLATGESRQPALMQAVFAQGMRTDIPARYQTTALQEGKRFSAIHVRAAQGERVCLDAHFSFQVPLDAPGHQQPDVAAIPPPEECPDLDALSAAAAQHLMRVRYDIRAMHHMQMRVVGGESSLMRAVAPGEPVRFWLRCGERLGEGAGMQAAGLAYLSDFWTAFAALAPHLHGLDGQPIYTATLSHSLWLHAPAPADDWLLVVQQSPRAANGRGLCFTRLYDQNGVLAATVAQEVLMARSQAG